MQQVTVWFREFRSPTVARVATTGAGLASRVIRGDAGALDALDIFIDGRRCAGDFAGVAEALDPLAAAAAGGDQEALGVLLGMVDGHGLARSTISRFLSDDGEVADAVQDTLFSVARNISRFESRSRFTTWLHPIAANAAKQVLRREHRVARPVDDPGQGIDPAMRSMSSYVASREDVLAALAALPAPQREILELRELQDLSYDEIAGRIGVEVGTVKSRLSRAREHLARLLMG